MGEIFRTHQELFEYPPLNRRFQPVVDVRAKESGDKARYVWPDSEMSVTNGGYNYRKSSERRRSMDDFADSIQLKSPGKMNDTKRLKDSGLGTISVTSSQRSSSSTKSNIGWRQAFKDYAKRCSLNGVPYISGYRDPRIKILWSFLLIAAIGVMMYHLSQLFTTYFSYEKHSKVKFSFNSMLFPAVTLCNVNALRKSKLENATDDLRNLVNSVDPDNMRTMISTWNNSDKQQSGGDKGSSDQFEQSNFFNNMPVTLNFTTARASVDSFIKEKYPDSWQSECETSTFEALQEKFRELWVAMAPELREQLGHQIDDMLIQCSFDGGQCPDNVFTLIHSAFYGNCYKIQYNKFITRSSGPSNGLELVLFLETDEYIPGITTAQGMHLVIHEQESLPFPDDEGIAVAAGTQTLIGLRKIEISRLGNPYGGCTEPEAFLGKYGIKYTRTACQKVCYQEMIIKNCKCFDEMSQQISSIMAVTKEYGPCTNSTEMQCLTEIEMDFEYNTDACDCNSPCNETQFQKTISSRQWPSAALAQVMVDMICKKSNDSHCQSLEGKSGSGVSQEFIKLTIYFEDLNYEELSEAADYELTQFLSDVGGTVGLYIGLSVLGVFELVHLLADIIRYLCCAGGKKVEQMKYG